MIDDAVTRIQAIEQKLTEKTQAHLQMRLTIRGCLKELRLLSHVSETAQIISQVASKA